MDFSTIFFLVCVFALWIHARKIEKRRRADVARNSETAAALTARIHALEQQILEQQIKISSTAHAHSDAAPTAKTAKHTPVAPPAQLPLAAKPPAPPPAVPSLKITEPHPIGPAAPAIYPKSPAPVSQPVATTSAPAGIPPAAQPKPREVAGIPLTPTAPAKEIARPPIAAATAVPNVAPPKTAAPDTSHGPVAPRAAAASASHAAPPLTRGKIRTPQSPVPQATQERVPFSSGPYVPTPEPKKEKRIPTSLEQWFTTNLLPKVGITLVVVGVAYWMSTKWGDFGNGGRAAILYAVGLGLLGGGIFAEGKERYKKIGRALIGGGWAITFVMTYAINHVPQLMVLPSTVADLVLMLAVAGVMVWHTLKYNSQTVTGLGFLLGFVSVTLNPDPPYNLIAAVVLVGGMTVIALRRQWYELEIFGILASYLNHFYWLYTIIHPMPENGMFPDYWNSVTLMVLYWSIFRTSYLLHKITNKEQEKLSTIAGLLNPLLFLAVMKYQSFHPELAFRALLIMGAIEFALGQLPVSHRRKTPFQILSSLGVTLMVVAVPFKYAGSHSLELLWMAGAEVFLLAGIFVRERLFRWFGGIISLLVAAYVSGWPPNGMIYHAARIINGQPHHDAALGMVLAVLAAFFYLNSHVLGRIWESLFDREVERQALNTFSFAASLFAVGAVYAAVADSLVAMVLAVLVTALAWCAKQFRISQLTYQAHWIALVAILDVSINAVHLDVSWVSIPARLITLGTVAALLYLSSNFVRWELPALEESAPREVPVVLYRWAGTGLIAGAIWMQISFAAVRRDWLIAMLWTAFALILTGVAQLLKRSEFKWQAFVLAMMSFCCALVVNFNFDEQFHHLSYRLISVTLVAGGIYLLARWAPVEKVRPAYSWAATILLGYLIYCETRQNQEPWTAVLWIGLAGILGLAARFWKDRALLWQTYLLAATATCWTLAITFQLYHDSHQHLMTMLIAVLITSALLYTLTWVTRVGAIEESLTLSPAFTWAATLLLACLAYWETIQDHELWTAVLWIVLAAGLGLAARFWKDRSLLWQTHLLSVAATGWTIYVAFLGKLEHHGTVAQLVTVLITSALLYGLTWVTRITGVIENDRIWQAYSWAGSLLLSWLAWYQLQPVNVSLAWGLFAVILFELGYNTSSSFLRAQAYVALTCSFAHLFYSNFNTHLEGGMFDPHILVIVFLVPIHFWVFWRLHEKTGGSGTARQLRMEYLLACLGTATVAALARFELPGENAPEYIVVSYAVIVLALLVTTWWSKLQVFLYQALIMLGVAGFRLAMHNFRNLSGSFVSALPGSLWAIGLLAAGIPIAFRLRAKEDENSAVTQNWIAFLVRRPEQILFFAAVLLMAALLTVKWPEKVTLFWGFEGVVVFAFALLAKERSFRLTGLGLLVICVAKIAIWDWWQFPNLNVRIFTLIGVGMVSLVISYLYARYKERLQEYL